MTKKEIKKFYLSLIDNPDAVWSLGFGSKEDNNGQLLLNCNCNNIKIRAYLNYRLVFTHTGSDSFNVSDTVTYKDIGISNFRLMFPYFGVADRIVRRIKRDARNQNSMVSTIKLDSISSILVKDKVLNRDTKLNQLLDNK